MIGGNAYFGKFPDKELLVRWAQANAMMPAMQFSIAPWDVSADVAQLCRATLALREEVVESLVDLSDAACESLEPMCTPLWWLDPDDAETYRIQDQFAIGGAVQVQYSRLVAPESACCFQPLETIKRSPCFQHLLFQIQLVPLRIGNDLIVAPVVTRGAVTRDVYLTEVGLYNR
jgi:alpha-glucosidase (family GH31 glycosyl hydrolase)